MKNRPGRKARRRYSFNNYATFTTGAISTQLNQRPNTTWLGGSLHALPGRQKFRLSLQPRLHDPVQHVHRRDAALHKLVGSLARRRPPTLTLDSHGEHTRQRVPTRKRFRDCLWRKPRLENATKHRGWWSGCRRHICPIKETSRMCAAASVTRRCDADRSRAGARAPDTVVRPRDARVRVSRRR